MNAYAEGTMSICIDEWPPYEYAKNHHCGGVSLDIVRSVLARMGQKNIEVVAASWTRCLQNVRKGEDDGALTGLKTEDRMEYAWYPDEPLTVSHWVFFVKKDMDKTLRFKTLDDLKGKRIGVIRGFNYPPDFITYARNNAILEYGADAMMNLRKLLDGRLDYVFEEVGPGMFGILELKAEDRIEPILDAELATEPIYVLFSKATVSPEFVKQFSDELRRFKQTEQYDRILKSYIPLLTHTGYQ